MTRTSSLATYVTATRNETRPEISSSITSRLSGEGSYEELKND